MNVYKETSDGLKTLFLLASFSFLPILRGGGELQLTAFWDYPLKFCFSELQVGTEISMPESHGTFKAVVFLNIAHTRACLGKESQAV